MKKYYSFALLTFVYFSSFSQIDISSARIKSVGSTVEIEGIVTNGDELGPIRYIQDETGGIAVYAGGTDTNYEFLDDARLGYTVRVKGVLKEYENLLEIDPIISYQVISPNAQSIDPVPLKIFQAKERYEGQLVTLDQLRVVNFDENFRSGETKIKDNSGQTTIYLRNDHPLIGELQPVGNFSLTGILSQYKDTYQILPRYKSDIVVDKNSLNFLVPPFFYDIQTNEFTVAYELAGAEWSRFYVWDVDDLENPFLKLSFRVSEGTDFTNTGLKAGHLYQFQACAINEARTDTLCYPHQYVSTISRYNTQLEVLFNTESYSETNPPSSETGGGMLEYVATLIRNASHTVDAALYNVDNNAIIDALNAAQSKGVRVRYVANSSTSNAGLDNASFPFIKGRGTDGIMHNKFFIIDGVTVITGSTNWTSSNIYRDHNNTVIIKDPLVASAYKQEMDEMWGSTTVTADLDEARFGQSKRRNTPTKIPLKTMDVRTYFSPTDHTQEGLLDVLDEAQEEVAISMLSFTSNELGAKLVELRDRGVDVRVIVSDADADGSEYEYLKDNGIEIYDHEEDFTNHNKYCVIDPDSQNGIVITGSHNWTVSAEERNDENTLVLYNSNLARIYMGEFEYVWCLASGIGCKVANKNIVSDNRWTLYPTTTEEVLQVELPDAYLGEEVIFEVRNTLGQLRWAKSVSKAEKSIEIPVTYLAAGVHYLSWQTAEVISTKKFIKM